MMPVSILFIAAFGVLGGFALPTEENALVKRPPEISAANAPSCPMRGAKGAKTKKGPRGRSVAAPSYVGTFYHLTNALNVSLLLTVPSSLGGWFFFETGEICEIGGVFWSAKVARKATPSNRPQAGSDYWSLCA
jgi:hypothetical protein